MSLQTLRVFEHETIRVGARTLDGALVPTNLDLDALARFCEAHPKQIYFRVGRKTVTFTEYVGYLQVGDVAFEVLPKTDRGCPPGASGRWRRALLTMLRIATGMDLRIPTEGAQRVTATSLLDLVAAAFLDELDSLLREGLARAYRSHETNGTTFRGRLLVSENVRHNVVRPDRFYVRFATFDADTLLNQILGEAVRVVSDLRVSTTLRARAAQHVLRFEDLARLRVTPRTFDRISLGRSTARYEKALRLARLILEGVAPALSYGRTQVVAFLFDMNDLWESFVAALFRRANVAGVSVSTQERTSFWNRPNAPPKGVRPDIVVRDVVTKDVLLVVDTKWKVPDGGIPSDDDLKQMFVYNELLGCSHAILLYPASTPDARSIRGTFDVADGHACSTVTPRRAPS